MGICVKIEVDDQGKISVGTEPYEEEAAEEQPGQQAGGPQGAQGAPEGAGDQGEQMTPVRSIDEALAMAKQLLSQGPQGQDQAQQEAGFQQGFAEQAPQSIAGLMR